MCSQMPTRNDCSRTYWTPAMERYFIDLMLEHMRKDNRVGHTFNKQAWTDMLNVFNAKFGSQYDKDTLKSHYTNLWKQFNDIKYLLGQSGFSWDGNRQMLAADDYTWIACIKVHPDARSYRTKPMRHFNDLCLIFGYTTADGRYSCSSHDIDFKDEIKGVNTGGILASGNERLTTDWTPEMDQYLIDLMLFQLLKDSKMDSTFSKQAWTEMLSFFNAKYGPQHGKRGLRHRFKKLWKSYRDITSLLQQEGFSWDEKQHIVTAADHIWDAYLKVHPRLRSYRTKTLPNYNDLVLIYGNARSVGNQNHSDDNKGVKTEITGTNGIDRSRTYWTPPMDHYLVDLLLEQVHKGNKLGRTFVTQGWVDMVNSFNVKFNSHHDKEVLKNRYKHLRRLYNEIKTLLEQDGFSWDDTRGMVVAEDHKWDAYTKVHPDARCHQIKLMPSYHKLRTLYGNEISDFSYSRLAQEAEPGSSSLFCGEENGDQFIADNGILMIEWTAEMNHHLTDLILKQMPEGAKIDQNFSELAWARMVDSFNKRFGLDYDGCTLKNQYLRLIREYRDINNILNESGFAWDGTQQTLVADSNVWDAYIKEHPDSIAYRGKVLENYNAMSVISGRDILGVALSCKGLDAEMESEAHTVNDDEFSAALRACDSKVEVSDQRKKRQFATPPDFTSCKVHKTGAVALQEALTEMAGVVTLLASKNEDKNYMTIKNAIDALQAIPDMDDELSLDACDLLEDNKKAKTFLALDTTLRKKWLLRKLRPSPIL